MEKNLNRRSAHHEANSETFQKHKKRVSWSADLKDPDAERIDFRDSPPAEPGPSKEPLI